MDAQEFKQRFMPFHQDLYRLAYYFTGNAADAEDLLQDLYLRLWVKRDEIVAEKQTRQYLATILRNLYIDSQRHVRPPVSGLSEADDPPDDITPETSLIERDQSAAVEGLIHGLSDKERLIIEMHVNQDLDYREIGQATGLSPGNIRVIMSRTKQKLREKFVNFNRIWKK